MRSESYTRYCINTKRGPSGKNICAKWTDMFCAPGWIKSTPQDNLRCLRYVPGPLDDEGQELLTTLTEVMKPVPTRKFTLNQLFKAIDNPKRVHEMIVTKTMMWVEGFAPDYEDYVEIPEMQTSTREGLAFIRKTIAQNKRTPKTSCFELLPMGASLDKDRPYASQIFSYHDIVLLGNCTKETGIYLKLRPYKFFADRCKNDLRMTTTGRMKPVVFSCKGKVVGLMMPLNDTFNNDRLPAATIAFIQNRCQK